MMLMAAGDEALDWLFWMVGSAELWTADEGEDDKDEDDEDDAAAKTLGGASGRFCCGTDSN